MGRGDFRNHAITNSFRKDSLTDLLNLAIQSPGNAVVDAEFAAYQARYLNRFIPTLKIDALSASYVQTDKAGQPGDIRCALWNLPESIIENYWTVADFDVMAPVVYRNPGRIISHDEILSEADWRAHPFFTQHCQKYAIHSALMINLRLPGKELTHITLEYLAGEENKSFRILDKLQLELATLPFAYAWFYRFGAIDFPILRRVFDLISDLTSTQLTFLRKFVSSPHLDLSDQARELGLSPAAFKHSLYQLRDELHSRIHHPDDVTARLSLRQIDHAYSFLKILRDPTAPFSPNE